MLSSPPCSRWFAFATALLGILFVGTVQAEESNKTDLAVHAVLREFGIYELIRDIPQTINDGIAQHRQEMGTFTPQQLEKLQMIAQEFFNEPALTARLRAELQRGYDESRYVALQRWTQSPLGRQLLADRRAASTAQGLEAIRKLAKNHEDKIKDKQRMEVFQRLDDAAADTEFFVAAQALAVHALLRMTAVMDSKAEKFDKEKREQLLNITYQQFVKPSKFTTRMTYLQVFDKRTNADLEQYLTFYSFGDVQWFLRQVMEALSNAMEQATVAAEKKMGGKS